ncbi:MAG: DinB family protein [Acidimicrobiales bacterium]
MTPCARCQFDWDAGPDRLVAEISDIGARYRRAIDAIGDRHPGVDPDAVIGARPSDGVWSPLEYVAHMSDVVEFYDQRIERVLVEDRPVMTVGAKFAELAETRRYRDRQLSTVLNALGDRGTAAARRLDELDDEQWMRVGIGSEGGERTVLTLARRLAHEAHHHLLDLG